MLGVVGSFQNFLGLPKIHSYSNYSKSCCTYMTKLVSMIQSMHHGNPWHEQCYNVNNLIFPSAQGILYNEHPCCGLYAGTENDFNFYRLTGVNLYMVKQAKKKKYSE